MFHRNRRRACWAMSTPRVPPRGGSVKSARQSATAKFRAAQYLADAHPEIKTVDDAMKHPELFPSSEDPSKGEVIQGPQGWGDTVVTAQLYKALDGDKKGFVLVPTGSAAALDGVITKAYERKRGYIAAYWAPTSLLVKYPMKRLEMAHDDAEWKRCTTVQ